MSRTAERQGFDAEARLRLLESDMDKQEHALEALEGELRAGFKKQETRLNAILVTLATSAILFAINIIAQYATGGG